MTDTVPPVPGRGRRTRARKCGAVDKRIAGTAVSRIVALIVAFFAVAGCMGRSRNQPPPEPTWPWAESRQDYIRRSQVWAGQTLDGWVQHMRRLDLLAGPPDADAFAPEELVQCTLVQPRVAFSGATPKFLCARQRDGRIDRFKVKWGEDNGEVYAEVAGSRLFWVLGFPADTDYPVRVECEGCADNPWRDRTTHPGYLPPVFAPAIIEREFPGRSIEEHADQGWTWAELNTTDPAAGGASRAQTEALKLLAAFVQHRDSKADNQRLTCMAEGVTPLPDGHLGCRQPVMLVHDLGSTFGGPALINTNKMDLEAWRSQPLWKDARRCIANVRSERDATDGLNEPQISEEGRRFMAALLDALDDQQIAALFTAARADRRGGVANWVAAFKERRDQLDRPVPADRAFRCPT